MSTLTLVDDPEAIAEQANLRYIDGLRYFGIKRKGVGKGFSYLDSRGNSIKDAKILKRIKDLNIPPGWRDVRICSFATGHIQAFGWDEKGRKQYIYHHEWTKFCQENKFNKMVFFGKSLIKIRRQLEEDLRIEELHRRRILATLVWLLENTFIRVGNEEYAEDNHSFGLTTLRNRHVVFDGKEHLELKFKGKSGVEHIVAISSPKIVKTIRSCIELPGYNLFQYIDEDGRKHTIDSEEVNEYLKQTAGEKVTAKDFRTWGGTVISATTLNKLGDYDSEVACNKNIVTAVKTVSTSLRNTPAVCRSYYIHPTVTDSYKKKVLIPHFTKIHSQKSQKPEKLTLNEFATLRLLEEYPLV